MPLEFLQDSEATGNLQRAQRACELLCDAGQRASQAVQLALEAYGPAEEAVAAGARADLELLQAGTFSLYLTNAIVSVATQGCRSSRYDH